MPKSDVYSWRLSHDRRMTLEEAARAEGTTVAALLDRATDAWIAARRERTEDAAARQARLHRAVEPFLGLVRGGDPDRATQARARLRVALARRHGR